MSPRLYIQKQVAALDSRKCCDTGEYILRSSTKQREGVGETVVASDPLLEGDEPGAVGGSDAGPTVLHLKTFVLGTVNTRMVGATGCARSFFNDDSQACRRWRTHPSSVQSSQA